MNTSLLRLLSENWGLVLTRGIIAIAFGILALLWPALTVLTLVILFGAYAIIDGCLALVAAFRGQTTAPRWWLVVVGIVGIAVGILTFAFPGLTAIGLLMFIAAWLIVRGVFEIIGAVHLRREIDGEWMLILNGIVSVFFGLLLAFIPGAGAIALVWLIALTAIIFGALLCGLAFRLRRHQHGEFDHAGMAHPA